MKYLLIPLLIFAVLGLVTPAYAADTVTFDAASINQNNFNFTVGNNPNRILLVVACNSTASVPVTAVSYNGVSMTKLDTATYHSTIGETTSWYLLAPSTGLNAVAFTGGSAFNGQVYSYYNVAQTVPEAHKITDGASSATITSSITTIAANALVYASTCFTSVGANAVTYSTNMGSNRSPVNGTDIGSVASNANADGGAVATPGSYTQTTTQAVASVNDYNMVQISLAPSGASQTPINFFQSI